jgi:hypothetical protein
MHLSALQSNALTLSIIKILDTKLGLDKKNHSFIYTHTKKQSIHTHFNTQYNSQIHSYTAKLNYLHMYAYKYRILRYTIMQTYMLQL